MREIAEAKSAQAFLPKAACGRRWRNARVASLLQPLLDCFSRRNLLRA